MSTSRLALGGAQFGFAYGITNLHGRIPDDEVRTIIEEGYRAGIRTIDTAVAYGDSEVSLGRALAHVPRDAVQLISKIPADVTRYTVEPTVRGSLERLGVPRLYGCLLHDVATIKRDPDVLSELHRLKRHGLVDRVGFSLYYPADLELIGRYAYDIVQVPYSVLDRRFEASFSELRSRGVSVHIRSVFLQGLLLSDPEHFGARFAGLVRPVRALRDLAAAHRLPRAALLLGVALLGTDVDRVIIGVDSIESLRDDIAAVGHLADVKPLLASLAGLAITDEDLLVPARWSQLD